MRDEAINRRKSIHQGEKSSPDIEKRSELKCSKCHSWYSFDSKDNQTKLNEDDSKRCEALIKDKSNLKIDFICSECGGWSLKYAKELYEWIIAELINSLYKLVTRLFQIIREGNLSGQAVLAVLVILALGFFMSQFYYLRKEEAIRIPLPTRAENEIWLDNQFDKLEEIYSTQDENLWSALASGIKSVLREDPHKPSVFLLVYDNEAAGKTALCLAKDVSDLATRYLMNRTIAPIMFHKFNTDFIEDSGELIPKFQGLIESSGSMIVANLQDVKPALAKIFHYFCDRYAPAVETAVYFFTLKVGGFRNRRAQMDAENELGHLWSNQMEEHFFQPLLTRLTPNTVKVTGGKTDC